jgi:alkylhydroperoxidase family enzyme
MSGTPAAPPTSISALENAEAWKRLPTALRGANQTLPVWARVLAGTMPRTTAAMLELDYLHRCQSPLHPALRGRMRWVAARANGCRYGEVYAAADLRAIGVDEAAIRALADGRAQLPEAEQAALAFARKLTRAAHTITDDEVSCLIEWYGEKQVVAMVLLVAYANFQDRLVLALDLPLEAGGPLMPLNVRFARLPSGAGRAGPPRRQPAGATGVAAAGPTGDAEWRVLDFGRLQRELEKQRVRKPRIKLPADDPGGIHWGLVCHGYQPDLAAAWAACTQAFGDEANQDRVFEDSLFWVVSRALQCFY